MIGTNFSILKLETFNYVKIKITDIMECKEDANPICWFCRKGRHEECMKQIPTHDSSDGPHDCTFNTKLIDCKCTH